MDESPAPLKVNFNEKPKIAATAYLSVEAEIEHFANLSLKGLPFLDFVRRRKR